LPAVFVPYPYAEKHQEANAKALEREGAALVIEQKEAAEGKLLEALIALVNDRGKLKTMGAAAKKAGKPEAARVLAGMLKELAEAKKTKR